MNEPTKGVVDAVIYAMRCGCFFPLRKPRRGAGVDAWVKWGAMLNLHNAVSKLSPTDSIGERKAK